MNERHSCIVIDSNQETLMSVIEDEHGEFHQAVRISPMETASFRVNYCAMCGGKAPSSAASIQGN